MSKLEWMLKVPQGEFVLHRLPHCPNELLRAFDAADEYLLEYIAQQGAVGKDSRLLLLNDSFGALAVALSDLNPYAMSDSYLSQQATRLNLLANAKDEQSVTFLNSLALHSGFYDIVLIKAPKTLALLEDQLIRLRPHLNASTQIVLAGMLKNMPSSVWQLVDRLIGPTLPSKAQKKARLIFAKPDLLRPVIKNPYPVCYTLENTAYRIVNHANVFSRDRLDIGTRFFLQHLPSQTHAGVIIDLGCGNGVVGLIAAERNPNAIVHFIDESFMAVASAEQNFRNAFGEERVAYFQIGDGLLEFASASADLILCNPPFHQQHAIGDQVAQIMFRESRRVLRRGGELWVIGNRHLDYHLTLKRWFGKVAIVAANAKFVIFKAVN